VDLLPAEVLHRAAVRCGGESCLEVEDLMDADEYEPVDLVEPSTFTHNPWEYSPKCEKCGRQWHGLPDTYNYPPCPGPYEDAVIIEGID
jgi:hypothetical protein